MSSMTTYHIVVIIKVTQGTLSTSVRMDICFELINQLLSENAGIHRGKKLAFDTCQIRITVPSDPR